MNSDREITQELIDAARYARDILNQIPAFGDSIGKKINKAQLATAWNKLSKAINKSEAALAKQ